MDIARMERRIRRRARVVVVMGAEEGGRRIMQKGDWEGTVSRGF